MNKAKVDEYKRASFKILATAYRDAVMFKNYTAIDDIKEILKPSDFCNEYQELALDFITASDDDRRDLMQYLLQRDYRRQALLIEMFSHESDYYDKQILYYLKDLKLALTLDVYLEEKKTKLRDSVHGLSSIIEIQTEINHIVDEEQKTAQPIETFQISVEKSLQRYEDMVSGRLILNKFKYYPTLNNVLGGGFTDGKILGVLGQYKSGKTTLGLNMILDIALQGESVAIFSLELPENDLQDMINANMAGIPYWKLKAPQNLSIDEKRALSVLSSKQHSIYTIYDCRFDVDIDSKIRLLNKKYGVKFFLVDYLQYVKSYQKQLRHDLEVSEISKRFVELKKELNINIILLSQANAAGVNKIPNYSNTAESMALPRDVDFGIVVFNPYQIDMQTVMLKDRAVTTCETDFIMYVDINRHNRLNKEYILLRKNDCLQMPEKDIEHEGSEYIQEIFNN